MIEQEIPKQTAVTKIIIVNKDSMYKGATPRGVACTLEAGQK